MIYYVEQGIKITVVEDGAGMTPGRLQEIQSRPLEAAGIGLNNVRRRLQLDYNQTLNITSAPETGTTV